MIKVMLGGIALTTHEAHARTDRLLVRRVHGLPCRCRVRSE
jgi:hypothetical protein